MKDKKNKAQDHPRAPIYPPSPHSLMGDPRLSMLAKEKEQLPKKKSSKLAAKIVTLICVLFLLTILITLLMPTLRKLFPEEQAPSDSDGVIPIDPPFAQDPDTTPTEPSTPALPELAGWERGKLVFDAALFMKDYEETYGEVLCFTYSTDQSFAAGPVLDEAFDRCATMMTRHFYRDGVKASYGAFYNVKFVARFFLLDELTKLRAEKDISEQVYTKECLHVVSQAAERMADITYDKDGQAKIPQAMLDALLGGSKSVEFAELFKHHTTLHNVLWSNYTTKDVIDGSLDRLSAHVARQLMLILRGYTYPHYSESLSDAEMAAYKDYYSQLNQGLDDTKMMAVTDKLAAWIRTNLLSDNCLLYKENGGKLSVGYSPFKFYCSLYEALPIIVGQLTDTSYISSYKDFLTNGRFVSAPYLGDVIRGRVNPYGKNHVIGKDHQVDMTRLQKLLAELNFLLISPDITVQADIVFCENLFTSLNDRQSLTFRTETNIYSYMLPFSLLRAGYDADGNYYLQSASFSALLTQAQYEEFIGICSEGTTAILSQTSRDQLLYQIRAQNSK